MKLNQVAESITTINTPSVSIAGELRCVITKADGTVTTDTGYQKNLILDQGLDFFGGGKGDNINTYCAIGSGNSIPNVAQTKLDAFVAVVRMSGNTSDYSYVDKGDNLYRMWEQGKYRFTGLDNVNISEVGLVSTGELSSNYYLTTRALIKDSLGEPTSISIKSDETLDIYYKIHKFINLTDKSYKINVVNGDGEVTPYDCIVRASKVGDASFQSVSNAMAIAHSLGYSRFGVSSSGLSDIKNIPYTATFLGTEKVSQGGYVTGSYKKTLTLNFGLNDGNVGGIRTVMPAPSFSSGGSPFRFLSFQVRYGSVDGDLPIPKTVNDTLTLPLEISWGRYEGVL